MLRSNVPLMLAILLLVPPATAAVGMPGSHAPAAANDTCAADCPHHPYIAGPGLIVDQDGLLLTACPEGCDLDGDGHTDVDPIGKVLIRASASYTNILISAQDDLWGNNAAQRACLVDTDGECLEGAGSEWSCGGTTMVLNSPFASDAVAVFIATLRVDADLEVCGGTMGTVDGTWF